MNKYLERLIEVKYENYNKYCTFIIYSRWFALIVCVN